MIFVIAPFHFDSSLKKSLLTQILEHLNGKYLSQKI